MTEKQIHRLLGLFVQLQKEFLPLPVDDAQWAISDTSLAIKVCVRAMKNRSILKRDYPQKGTIFQLLQVAKSNSMQEIFLAMNDPYFEYFARVLRPEELVKSFDFFSKFTEKEDDEESDVGLLVDYSVACREGLISESSLEEMKKRIGADFFGL